MKTQMIIVASKVFATEDPHSILHMPHPCSETLKALFAENSSMQWIVVTDCVEPLFEADMQRIEKEKQETSTHTHVKGVFVVHRSLTGVRRQNAPTWQQMFE